MSKYLMIVLSFLVISCKKDEKEILKQGKRKTTYKREWVNIIYSENERQEIELYISDSKDTIVNQQKTYIDNTLDKSRSNYYELTTLKTNTPNEYQARIEYFTGHKSELPSKRIETYFSYREETIDSAFFTTIKVTNKNIIDFKYTNVVDSGVQGLIIENIEIDTIVEKEKMVRMIKHMALVDNQLETLNYSLEPFGFLEDNRFEFEGVLSKVE